MLRLCAVKCNRPGADSKFFAYTNFATRAWRDGQFQLVTSEAILAEIAKVLGYRRIKLRHLWSEEQIEIFLEDVAHLAIVASPKQPVTVIAEDPSDDRYLECAVEGEGEYVVSGDQHLLSLRTYEGITILKPAVFAALLRSQARRR